ncbi:oxidoreductase [Acetobacter sp. DmW_043]|nr:SDR family NAD(P)-dependent oxidoreductase [Acetobacter thailandicus]OUI85589.1 oxidoreductase [Acetobacter sp. DmW_043]
MKEKRGKNVSTNRPEPKSILITGATGGIGGELAKRYARPGRTLILWGRDEEKLRKISAVCGGRGAKIISRQIDLAKGQDALSAFYEDDAIAQCDMVILGAGLSDIKTPKDLTEDPQKVLQLALVNYTAPVTLATAAARRMIPRKGGRVVLIGSVSAYYELPFSAAYSSSKAGLASFASAARLGWEEEGIKVIHIAPGFVDTQMSQRLKGSLPFLVSVENAAKRIMKAIHHNEEECIFPWQFRILRVAERLVPQFLRKRILKSIRADQE